MKSKAKRIERVKSKPKRNVRVKSKDQTMKKLPIFEWGQIWHKMANFSAQKSKNRHMLKNLESVRNITSYLFTKKAGGGHLLQILILFGHFIQKYLGIIPKNWLP